MTFPSSPVFLYFVIIGVLIAATSCVLRVCPAVAKAVLGGESGRKHTLDGIRGILALSVFIHHTMLPFVLGGVINDQTLHEHRFISQMGSASVAIFFMISAYLFGGKLLRSSGRLNTISFFYGRFMRIVPLHVVAVAITVFLSFQAQDFALVEPIGKLAKEIGRFLLFDFVSRYDINGFKDAHDLLPQVWSLHFEWLLYFEIPVMALLYRLSGRSAVLYIPLLISAIFVNVHFYFFVGGLLAAQLASLNGSLARRVWQYGGAICLIAIFATFDRSMSLPVALLLVPPFVAIVQGHRIVSLLGWMPLRFLGEISYSIYLLHGVLMFIFFSITGFHWDTMTTPGFVAVDIAIGLFVIAASTITFLLVEKPLMHFRRFSPAGNAPVPLPSR